MPNRISKTWVASDFLVTCRIADDMHRVANSGTIHVGHAGDSATGAIVSLLDSYATRCDMMDVAKQLGCAWDSKALAYAIRDAADDRKQAPSTVFVELFKLQVL